jgi:hypothetical protein
MSFQPLRQPIDHVLLAGQKSPGLGTLVGASSPREWDERKGYGISGSFSVFRRRGLAHFALELRLYNDQDWADWHAWKPIVDKVPTRRGGGTNPASGYLKIQHPILEDLSITAVGVEDVGQPTQAEDGVWLVVIKFIEFRQPVFGLAKPEGAKAVPVDPYDAQLEKLTGQFNELADG